MATGKVRPRIEIYWKCTDSLTEALNLVWPHFFNGCNVTRPTDEWLMSAGDWTENTLKPGQGEGKYDSLPHTIGTLTKA